MSGRLIDSPYFNRYAEWTTAWRMVVGEVDGEPAIVVLRHDNGAWAPKSFVRLEITHGHRHPVADYTDCPWSSPQLRRSSPIDSR